MITKIVLMSTLLGTLGGIFLYISSPYFSVLFFHTFKYLNLVRLLAVDLFFTLISGLLGSILWGLQNFKSQAKWNILGLIISYSLPVIFLLFYKNINFIVIGWAMGYAFSSFAFAVIIFRRIRKISNSYKEKNVITPMIKYSIPIFLSSIVGYGASYVDRFVVSYLLNLSLLGIYNFALLISSALSFVIGPFGTIMLPKLSEMYGKNDIESMKYSISKGIEIMTAIYAPIALLVASLSPYILLFLSNPEYLPASLPVIIILFITTIFVSLNVMAVALQSIRKTKIFIISSSIALISNFILSIILIPKLQMVGAAIGYSSITFFSFIVYLYYSRKYNILKFEGIKLAKIYASSFIMFIIIITMENFFYYSVIKLFSFIFLGFIIYIVLLKSMKTFNKEDIEFLINLVPNRIKKYRKVYELILLPFVSAD